MCDKFVSYLPWTLAPNVITIVGVACVAVTVLLQFALYGTNATGYVDPWFMILAGVLYFINTVLDNMDGKQARRTGAGSPMGMLFDHGSDAFTAIMSSLILGKFF
jgi:ethanolaminephosphotransferase